MLIFFAVTGSWQIFDWHQSDKAPGGYRAPTALAMLSDIHKDAHIPPTKRASPAPVRYFMFAAALGLLIVALAVATGLGLGSLMGQRTVPVILLIVLEIIITPVLADHPLPFRVVVAVHQMVRRVAFAVRHRANRQHER